METIVSDREPEKSYGLYNVHTRLKKLYGPSSGLTLRHIDGKTNVSFLIPPPDALKAGDLEAPEPLYSHEDRRYYG